MNELEKIMSKHKEPEQSQQTQESLYKPKFDAFGIMAVGLASTLLTIFGLCIGIEMYETKRFNRETPINESLWDLRFARADDSYDLVNTYMNRDSGEIIYINESQRIVSSDAPEGVKNSTKGRYVSKEELYNDWQYVGQEKQTKESETK